MTARELESKIARAASDTALAAQPHISATTVKNWTAPWRPVSNRSLASAETDTPHTHRGPANPYPHERR